MAVVSVFMFLLFVVPLFTHEILVSEIQVTGLTTYAEYGMVIINNQTTSLSSKLYDWYRTNLAKKESQEIKLPFDSSLFFSSLRLSITNADMEMSELGYKPTMIF